MKYLTVLLGCCVLLPQIMAILKRSDEDLIPATVRIHETRSTKSKMYATVAAEGKNYDLMLTARPFPKTIVAEIVIADNGNFTIVPSNSTAAKALYTDPLSGVFMFMNSDDKMEGFLSDTLALRYIDGQHYLVDLSENFEMRVAPNTDAESLSDQTPEEAYLKKRSVFKTDELLGKDFKEEFKERKYDPFDSSSSEEGSGSSEDSNPNMEDNIVTVETFVFVDSLISNWVGEDIYLLLYTEIFLQYANNKFSTLDDPIIYLECTYVFFSRCESVDALAITGVSEDYSDVDSSIWQYSWLANYIYDEYCRADVALQLTGRDLAVQRGSYWDNSRRRVAWRRGGVCTPDEYYYAENVAIVEDDGFYGGVFEAARAIAEILGASEDGTGDATSCPSSDGYIMGYPYYLTPRSFTFSPCSKQAIQETLNSEAGDCVRSFSCPLVQYETSSACHDWLPGFTVSQTEQCRFYTKYYLYNNQEVQAYESHDDIQCAALRCVYYVYEGIYLFEGYVPPLDGTQCYRSRSHDTVGYCFNGECIHD